MKPYKEYIEIFKIKLDGTEITPKDANGKTVEPFIIDGTTYLPVRAVGDAMGLDVDWNNDTSTVILSSVPIQTSMPTQTSLSKEEDSFKEYYQVFDEFDIQNSRDVDAEGFYSNLIFSNNYKLTADLYKSIKCSKKEVENATLEKENSTEIKEISTIDGKFLTIHCNNFHPEEEKEIESILRKKGYNEFYYVDVDSGIFPNMYSEVPLEAYVYLCREKDGYALKAIHKAENSIVPVYYCVKADAIQIQLNEKDEITIEEEGKESIVTLENYDLQNGNLNGKRLYIEDGKVCLYGVLYRGRP